jgi:hypothetical protein
VVLARQWSPRAVAGLALVLLVLSVPPAIANELRALIPGARNSVLTRDRISLYFADHPDLKNPDVAAAAASTQSGCRNIGLDFSMLMENEHEYALLALLGAERGERNVRHVSVANPSSRYATRKPAQDFAPCSVICPRCLTAGEKWEPYIAKGSRVTFSDNAVVLSSPDALLDYPIRAPAQSRVILDNHRTRPGERVVIGLAVQNPENSAPADLYVGMILPGAQSAVFAVGPSGLSPVISLAMPAKFPPIASAPRGYAVNTSAFWTFTFPKTGLAPGIYRVFATLVRQGAFRGNQVGPACLLALDAEPLLVSP